jgi:predicted RND superfamily exporter protein
MFNRFAYFLLRNRPLVLTLFAIGTIVMLFSARNVKLAYENNKLVPHDDKDFIDYKKFTSEFGEDGNKLVLGIQSPKVFDLTLYNDLYDANEKLRTVVGVKEVLSITSFYNLVKEDEKARFSLVRLPSKKPSSQSELDSIRDLFLHLGFYKNAIYNTETHASLTVLTINPNVLDTEERVRMVEAIDAIMTPLGQKHGLEVHYSGIPYVRTAFAQMVKGELFKFTFLAISVTALLLLLFFRSFVNFIIPLFLVGVSVVWSMGIIGIAGYKLTILTGIIPPLMVVIGIPNCIYLLNKYHIEFRKHGNKIKALTRIVAKVGPANLLTNFTTSIGFGVFYFTKTTLLTQFGVVTFFSILSISLLTVVLLPVIYSFLPPPTIRQTKHLENKYVNQFIAKVHFVVFNRKRVIYFFAFASVFVSVLGLVKLKPLVYVVDDIPKDSKIYTDLQFFEHNFKGIMPLDIIIDTEEEDGLKQTATLQRIATLQKRLDEYDEMARSISVVDVLAFANQAWNDGNEKYYRLPSKTTLGNIVNYLPSFTDTTQKSVMSNVVDASFRKTRISIQLADVGSARMAELTEELRAHLGDIFPKDTYTTKVTGTSYLFLVGNRYLVKSLFQSVLIAFIIIAIIMGTLFTSFKMIIVSLIPNIIPMLITAGIMGWAEVPLKPSTILVFSIAFGIAIDDTIHFLAKFRQELKQTKTPIKKALSLTLNEMGTSLLYTSVVLFFGFSMFAFSDFQGTVSLGVLTSVSLFFALFSNIFVLPALILSYEKRLNPRHELKESVIELPDDSEEE